MSITHVPRLMRRKPRLPAYLKKPLFPCTRRVPEDLLFSESGVPTNSLFLDMIHQVQHEIYNCTAISDTIHLVKDVDRHFIYRAYEYAKSRKFAFDIIANNNGFALEFYHKEIPGKIVAPMGSFDIQGVNPEFILTFVDHVFKITQIMALPRTNKLLTTST